MSLVCGETLRQIEFGDPLMVGLSAGGRYFTALSQEVLSKIPNGLKSDAFGDVNIHVAVSKKNFNGSYTCTVGFKMGDFLYSISSHTGRRYLPRYMGAYHSQEQEPKDLPPMGADW